MADRSKKVQRPVYPLEELSVFKDGKRIEFDSMAEMITVRAREIPDKTHVLYYDEVITYARTNQQSNRVANYLIEMGVKKGDVVSAMVLNSPEAYGIPGKWGSIGVPYTGQQVEIMDDDNNILPVGEKGEICI
ncbi:MAG: AMP-binding protein, partial [Desulfocucumaceae bacterium]